MRTGSNRIFRPKERDPADDFSVGDVEFSHTRGVPETAPGAATVAGSDQGVGERGRHQIAGAEIEFLKCATTRGIQKYDVVGKIVRHQKLFATAALD